MWTWLTMNQWWILPLAIGLVSGFSIGYVAGSSEDFEREE